ELDDDGQRSLRARGRSGRPTGAKTETSSGGARAAGKAPQYQGVDAAAAARIDRFRRDTVIDPLFAALFVGGHDVRCPQGGDDISAGHADPDLALHHANSKTIVLRPRRANLGSMLCRAHAGSQQEAKGQAAGRGKKTSELHVTASPNE